MSDNKIIELMKSMYLKILFKLKTINNDIIYSFVNNFDKFMKFLIEKNVLQVFIGFVIATNVTKITNSLVDVILTPLITIITFGKINNIKTFSFKILGVEFKIGLFISVIIDVILMLLIVFFVWRLSTTTDYTDIKKSISNLKTN